MCGKFDPFQWVIFYFVGLATLLGTAVVGPSMVKDRLWVTCWYSER